MNRTVVLVGLMLLGSAGTALAESDTDITIDASALYMTRSDGSSNVLVSTNANPGSGDVFSSPEFEPGFVPGAKGRIAEHEDDVGFEVGGFFLSQASESRSFIGGSSTRVYIETNPETSYGASDSTLTGHDSSGIIGADAHFSWDVDPDVTLYAGPRYILLTEKFNLFGDFGGGEFENDVWGTRNVMWGGEIGARSDLLKLLNIDAGGLALNADVGVGVLDDSAHTSFRTVSDSGPDTDFSADRSASQASAVVSLGLTLAYPITDMFTIQGGYDLLYLSSVETATGQVPVTGQYNDPPTTLGSNFESVLYHGFEVGLSVHL